MSLDDTISRRDLFKGIATVGASFGALMSGIEVTQAETQNVSLGEAISNLDAANLLEDARDYSRTGEGIAVLAFVGDDIVKGYGFSPEQIGHGIVGQLGKGQAFVAYNGEKSTAITLITKVKSFGPSGFDSNLESNIALASAQFEQETKFSGGKPGQG